LSYLIVPDNIPRVGFAVKRPDVFFTISNKLWLSLYVSPITGYNGGREICAEQTG